MVEEVSQSELFDNYEAFCQKMEEQASIADRMEDVWSLRTWEERRRAMRDIYFSVDDRFQRQNVIQARRSQNVAQENALFEQVKNTRKGIHGPTCFSLDFYTVQAGILLALVLGGGGYWLSGLVGAVGGAALGTAIGWHWTIQMEKWRMDGAIEIFLEAVDELRAFMDGAEPFTEEEAKSGERDPRADKPESRLARLERQIAAEQPPMA